MTSSLNNGTLSTKEWLEATKDMTISSYVDDITTDRILGASDAFIRGDFERAVRKVSRRKPSKTE